MQSAIFSLRQSGTISSFVFRFCALRGQKRNTDTIGSTMLPQANRTPRGLPRKLCPRFQLWQSLLPAPIFKRSQIHKGKLEMTKPQSPAPGTLAVWAGEESYLLQG